MIVQRGDAQETTIIGVHYSRWVGKIKRAQETFYIGVPVQRSTE